jgi:hypothetical protein
LEDDEIQFGIAGAGELGSKAGGLSGGFQSRINDMAPYRLLTFRVEIDAKGL